MKNVINQYINNSVLLFLTFTTVFVLFVQQRALSQDFAINFGRSVSDIVVHEDNMQNFRLTFTYSGLGTFIVETDSDMSFNEIAIPGTYSIGEIGTPKLPASKKLMEVPFGAEIEVKVKNYTTTEYQLSDYGINFPIIPVQPSLRKDQDVSDVPFEFDKNIYEKDFFIKHELASVEVLGVLRGYRIARLTIAPVSYNPYKGIIKVYNDIEVEISFINADEALNDYIKATTWSPYFEVVGKRLINNIRNGGYPAHPDLTKYPVKYLIVSNRMFENDLQPFIEWKIKKGYKVIVAYTDEIGNTYTQIQSYIHQQYNQGTPTDPPPSFVLLVGDTPQLPSTSGSSTGKMTDLYYASVDGDYFPEMYYGRFSATNSAQLVSQIAKTLYYERYEFEDPTYLNDVTLIAGADGTWNPRIGQPTVQYGTINYFNAAHGYTNVNAYLTSPYTGCYSPEKIAVSMINYSAHCNETCWGDPNLTISMVNAFVNNGKYPLAVGNCCLAADFGYGECIGETWQRAANKGSVAYIGSAPSSYWFEDFYYSVGAFPLQGNNNGYVPTFEETTWGAYDAPFVSDYVTTGSLNFVGNLAVTEVHIQGWPSHSSPLYYWQAYNVLGDPSLVAYHTEGTENTVSHMPIVPIGMNYYEVTAEPGSYVGISKDGVLHGCALVDETGIVEVPMDPILDGGMVDIVVTKPQFIPYMVQIPAAALEGPYIVLDGYTISDPTGNNNGLADYGENINLNVTLKNVGADPSASVNATVSGSDQYVTLTSTATKNFGTIPAGGTATVNNAWSFSIDDFVPDQHKAQFILTMTDGSDTWTSNLFITIQSPIIFIAEEFLVDDSQSGNNDGILDPGETALIIMNVKNNGHSAISNTIINITSTDPMLTINTPTVNIASLDAGASQEYSFNVSASETSPIGYPVNVNLNAEGGPDGQYTASCLITVVIGLIPEYIMTNATITTCVGEFYDSGGPNGQYGSNEDLVMTFLPLTDDGIIKAEFISFETETNYDFLYIHNGANTSAPQVTGSPFHGTMSPGTIVGLNADGALTFRFKSDYSVTKAGWSAHISCHYLQGLPECASSPSPTNNAQNVSLNSNLSWVSYDAVTFDVYFGLVPDPPFVETVPTPLYTPVLEPNTTYYWKIIPINANGQASDCPVWSFTTSGPEYYMSNGTVTVNSGVFYDSGGPNANYSNHENYTMTFLPIDENTPLKFTFTQFDIENNWDYLYIYNGPNTTATQFPGSPFTGTYSPGTITSTHPTGAITFRFTSDYSVVKSGWIANFITVGNLACNITANPEEICQGGYSLLNCNVSGGTGNYNFNWSPASSLSNPNVQNPIATPNETTTYTVTINDGATTISDNYTLVVHELPPVNLGEDVTVCETETVTLDATTPNAVSYLWTPGGYTTAVIQVDTTGVGIASVTYTCQVTDVYGCVGQDDITITFKSCVGINEISDNISMLVYPNPTKNLLNISFTGVTDEIEYALLNYHGQQVYSNYIGKLNGSVSQEIRLDNLARGVYYLRINSSDGAYIKKVVLQ